MSQPVPQGPRHEPGLVTQPVPGWLWIPTFPTSSPPEPSLQKRRPSPSPTLWTHLLHTPPAWLQVAIFHLLLKNKKLQKQRWRGCGLGRQQEGAGPWPSSPLSPLLFPIGEGQDLGSRDGGMDTGGAFTAKGQWSCQGSLEGGSPRPGAKRCEGAEFPSQGPKASRVGQAPCLATEERRLWAAGCWFIYCRVSRASQPPRGMG